MADENGAGTQAEAPKRISFTIQNIDFDAEAVYAAGHTLNAEEASVLNQTRVENLRNNFAARIKSKLDQIKKDEDRTELTEDELAELRAQFADYEASYEFQGKRATRAPVDPVRKEAHKMAREAITAALRSKNIDPKNLVEGRMEQLMAGYLEKNPQVVEEAKRRVQAVKDLAGGALAGVTLSEEDMKAPAAEAEDQAAE